jgi:hypothetical protein
MARIFTIDFSFENALHHAIVSVRETPFHTEYKITLQSPQLNELLLSDKILSPQPQTFLFANVATHEYNPLMKEVLVAVSGYIHSFQH